MQSTVAVVGDPVRRARLRGLLEAAELPAVHLCEGLEQWPRPIGILLWDFASPLPDALVETPVVALVENRVQARVASQFAPLAFLHWDCPAVQFAITLEAIWTATEVSPRRVVPGYGNLSEREREVLDALLEHKRPPQIARELFISPHTVRNHLKSIYGKLGVRNQASLIDRMLGRG